MRRIFTLASGIIAALIMLLFLFPLIEGLLVGLLTTHEVSFRLGASGITADYAYLAGYGVIPVSIILFSPLIVSIIIIELTIMILNKIENDRLRGVLILLQLSITGYIIFLILLGILSLVPGIQIGSLWTEWIKYTGAGGYEKLMITFGLIFMVFIYLNLVSRRIKFLIPSVKSESTLKNKNGIK